MLKQNKRRAKRVTNLIVICTLLAVILSVSTYAWFIGMRTVNVSSFDVEIASTESLLLSLDGEIWDTTVDISKETLEDDSYIGHTNSWAGTTGLFPVSSIGDMDPLASRMKLFEKASLTTTPGGYRLLASRVHNYELYAEDPDGAGPLAIGDLRSEQNGYVAFDLFIKNFSGNQYITELEPKDEEAIYLTTDSAVSVAAAGVANTGIENSVRVAFGQIGRVIGTTNTPSVITGITCEPDSETGLPSVIGAVTGICRTAQIWEPNDTKHVVNAISWYDTSCRPRLANPTGADVTKPESFDIDGTCSTVANNTAYRTYAVSNDIASADNIDVYDGGDYNGYASSSKLVPYNYFTDTKKVLTGVNRPTFMTLAPNSITKVRIYIYIEGQDVDNYDFASIGKKISVKFGFTKERFTEDDIDYPENGGPQIHVPVLTLLGNSSMTVAVGGTFTDPGATALDNVDGDLTDDIVASGTVDTSTAATYTVTYNVSDNSGNSATPITRTVIVE